MHCDHFDTNMSVNKTLTIKELRKAFGKEHRNHYAEISGNTWLLDDLTNNLKFEKNSKHTNDSIFIHCPRILCFDIKPIIMGYFRKNRINPTNVWRIVMNYLTDTADSASHLSTNTANFIIKKQKYNKQVPLHCLVLFHSNYNLQNIKKKNKNNKNKNKKNNNNNNNVNNTSNNINYCHYNALLKQLFFNEIVSKPIVNISISRKMHATKNKNSIQTRCCWQLGVIGIEKENCNLTNIIEFLQIINDWKNNKNAHGTDGLSSCLRDGNIFQSIITSLYANGFDFREPDDELGDWRDPNKIIKQLIACCVSCYFDSKKIKGKDTLTINFGFSMYPPQVNVDFRNFNKNLDTQELFKKHRYLNETFQYDVVNKSIKLLLKFDYSKTQLSFYCNDWETPLPLKQKKAKLYEKSFGLTVKDNIICLNKNYYYIPWFASCSYDSWMFQTKVEVIHPQNKS